MTAAAPSSGPQYMLHSSVVEDGRREESRPRWAEVRRQGLARLSDCALQGSSKRHLGQCAFGDVVVDACTG